MHAGALDDVSIEIIGGRDRKLPPGALDGLRDDLVVFRDPVDYVPSLDLMGGSDLLLVLDAPADRSVFLPSKLVDYLGARRPIVALTPEGAAANLVRRARGWHADPSDPAACAASLFEALEAVRAGDVAHLPPADVVAEYAAATVARHFNDVLVAVAARQVTGPRL
jgi:hypothetical protein